MIVEGYAMVDDDACGALITVMFGYVFAIVGVGGTAIGAIPMLIHNKRYKVDKKWNLEKGTVALKMSRKEMKEAGLK